MTFSVIDVAVVVAYMAVVIGIGLVAMRRPSAAKDEFFLAGRGMPVGAVALSVFATAFSAATFLGGPEQAYARDLTYFSANFGGLLAVILVAIIFVPAFFRAGVTSVYELLGQTWGQTVQRAASAMFMLGRVFASGSRLFIVALAVAVIAFGDAEPRSIIISIAIVTSVTTLYTVCGGIRAVIWTDVIQAILVAITVAVALGVLYGQLDMSPGEIAAVLDDGESANKLRIIDLSIDPTRPFTLWTALIGFTLLNMAWYGADQDLTQRLLTCRSARAGAWSLLLSQAVNWPVVMLFLVLGLLLYVRERVGLAPAAHDDTRQVFLRFILEMPSGLRGLMVAGLFSAAMGSLSSALNAMASTTIADFVRPITAARRGADDVVRDELLASRLAVIGWAVVLGGFASLCVFWQRASGETLIEFALGVMVFAYGGLLGVFLTALLTRRGNSWSALAALMVGLGTAVALDPIVWSRVSGPLDLGEAPAFAWRMTAATIASFTVCCAARRPAQRTVESAPMRSIAASSVASSLQNAKRTSDRPPAGS